MKEKKEIISEVEMSASVQTRFRKYFSIQHIQSSALFSRLSYEIENKYDGTLYQDLIVEHRAYVTNAIISAVSCIEANINEFYADVSDENANHSNRYLTVLSNDTVRLISDMWKLEVPRTSGYSIIEKYEIALTLARKQKIDRSSSVYGNITILVKLRNALIHYEPEWLDSPENDNARIHSFEQKLKGKFKLNPLTGAGNPFYPDKCLSHGCAEWACKSCIDFIDYFSKEMGIPSRFDHVRGSLSTR